MADSYSPPRFWWLKRLSLGLVVVLGIVSVIHAGLWWWADRRIERERAAWIAAGGPDPTQAVQGLPPQPVGDDNVALGVIQAHAATPRLTQAQNDNWEMADPWVFPLKDAQLSALRSIVEQDRPVVDQYRQVIQRPRLDWGFEAVTVSGLLPSLNGFRDLANHLSWRVFIAQHDGDLRESLRAAHDVLAMAPISVTYGNTLVSSFVSTGISLMGTSRLRDHVIGRGPLGLSPEEERSAWRENRSYIREKLIPLLLDEEYERDLIARGFRGEWVMVDSVRNLPAEWSLSARNAFTAPFFDTQLADLLHLYTRVVQAAETARGYNAMIAAAPPVLPSADSGSMAGVATAGVGDLLSPSHERAILTFFRAIADRRATAVLLALELYAADHEGQLPASLAELVPEYLPAVPTDPFSPNGAPLGYRRDMALPLVYSVGGDAIDNRGSVAPAPGEKAHRSDTWNRTDYVFPLRYPEDFQRSPYEELEEAHVPGEPTTRPQ